MPLYCNSFVYKWSNAGFAGFDAFTLDQNGKIVYYFETDQFANIDCPVANNFLSIYLGLWNTPNIDPVTFSQEFDALFATNGVLVLGSHADRNATDSAGRKNLFQILDVQPSVIVSEVFCSESNPNSFVYKWVMKNGAFGFDSFEFDNSGKIILYYETDTLVL